jgi:P22_AR N-terminal domain
MENQIIKISGAEVIVTSEQNVPYIFIKPVCDFFGVDANSQYTRIKKDEILADEVREYGLHDTAGRLQKSMCLPIHHFHAWLLGIQTNMIANEEAKPKLIKFKREAHQALYDHFFGKYKIITNVQKITAEKKKRNKEINRMVNALLIEHKENASIIEQNSNITLQQLGFWEEEAEITELPDQLTGKQFYLKKA